MSKTSALPDFFNDLRRAVKGEVRTDAYSRVLYSTDASIYQMMPHGVLIPRHLEDVQAAVELAARYRLPLLPRTGGSSLAGQAVNEALVIDFSHHLDQVLEINPREKWVRVQPGVVLDELNEQLKIHGLQFGPDPASSNRAAMGGIVSNNSTGAHSILYGMTADHILECRGFLSDGSPYHFYPLEEDQLTERQKRPGIEGTIYREIAAISRDHAETIRAGTPRHWRRCGGYNLDRFVSGEVSYRYPGDSRFNLAKLVCGAEGTLAIMSEIKLNLVDRPSQTALALVHFSDLPTALSAVPVMLEAGPSAIELLDNLALTMCRDVPEYARLLKTFMEGSPHCIMISEFYGKSEAELRHQVERLQQILQNQRIPHTLIPAFDPHLQQNVWTVRKVGLGLLMSIKGDHKPLPFIEDAAVPPEHLAEYIQQVENFCHDLGTKVAYYAHASAGCLHVRPLINAKVAGDLAKLPQIARFSAELLGEYGGALSSEHGDGRCRSWLNERFYGKGLYDLYGRVKRAFDPHGLLNPGIIVNPQQMTENLRYGEDYATIPVKENLDFSKEGGLQRAIEMCNGAGVCRKRTTGTMCPSFMVTREEEHSTRGRANALRAALSGRLPAEELTSPRMFEVLDLCIECKACQAECPSSVDMAKIKFEFLARYYQQRRVPLRTRLFANMPTLSRWAANPLGIGPYLANAALENRLTKRLLERFLGISGERSLPRFAREDFVTWYHKHRSRPGGDLTQKQVVLFNDTFNTYNDPHIAIAAVELLEAAGYDVLIAGKVCCGRPAISKGLVDLARQSARDTIERLAPLAERGLSIVGLEPSCLLSLRDDYRYLLPGDARVEQVAAQSLMLEEFIIQLLERNELQLKFAEQSGQILLHGHCHQKALVGSEPSKRMLSLPGYAVEEVDSGCCGMAGSFGYEKEHYQISRQMAEHRLLPAVRRQSPETLIVAAGTSCRHQIWDGSGRRAYHPAEVLRRTLKNSVPPNS